MRGFNYIILTFSTASIAFASVTLPRAVVNGACTGQSGLPGVCISTSACTSGGGNYISNKCPGTPDNIKCCTKPACGTNGGNCRWTSQCSSNLQTVSGFCPGPGDFKCCQKKPSGGGSGGSTTGGPITRKEIIERGQYWISRHVPYSMTGYYRDPQGVKYRTDCSGFVSMALHSSAPGRTTTSLLQIADLISWNSLQPGDFVGTLGAGTGGSGGHVTLFLNWANSGKTRYVGLECRGTAYGCVKHERPIKWKVGSHVSKPYRYIHVK